MTKKILATAPAAPHPVTGIRKGALLETPAERAGPAPLRFEEFLSSMAAWDRRGPLR
jgi:hypothetical protein